MTETSQGRPSAVKGDVVGSFSDADSGYDDPGVITIPVVRTVVHSDPKGRKVSTTSTEFISVKKKNEAGDSGSGSVPSPAASSPESSPKILSSSTTSIDSPKSRSSRSSQGGSKEFLHQSNSSLEMINESGISSGSNHTMDSFDSDEFDISQFMKEYKKENENERKLRFLSTPRDERGRPRPVVRNIATTTSIVKKEETTKKTPRRKVRSKSADSRRKPRGPQSLFSPTYSKVLSPETMRNRKMWADIVKRDCILEEEYYKVPYEECNREIIFGRLCSSETLLNNFRRLKKQSMIDKKKDLKAKEPIVKESSNASFSSKKLSKTDLRNQFFNIGNSKPENELEILNNTINSNPEVGKEPNTEDGRVGQTTADQIQQLINDLNNIAYSNPKTEYQKNCCASEIECNEGRIDPIDSNYNSPNYVNQNMKDKRNLVIMGDKLENEIVQEESAKSSHSPSKKKKSKKNVSFSNENEELIFESAYSDSDSSSVFEGQFENTPNILQHSVLPPTDDQNLNRTEQNSVKHRPQMFSTTDNTSQPNFLSADYINSNKAEALTSHNKNEENIVPNNLNNYYLRDALTSPLLCQAETYHLPVPQEIKKRNETKNNEAKNFENRFIDQTISDMNKFSENAETLSRIKDTYISNGTGTQFYNRYPNTLKRENAKDKKKNVQNNFRGDKVNIYMTKGPSFTEHQIHLLTRMNSQRPNVSITRIKVPFSSIQDQWEWIQSFKNNNLLDENQDGGLFHNSFSTPEPVLASKPLPLISRTMTEHKVNCLTEIYHSPDSHQKHARGNLPTAL